MITWLVYQMPVKHYIKNVHNNIVFFIMEAPYIDMLSFNIIKQHTKQGTNDGFIKLLRFPW